MREKEETVYDIYFTPLAVVDTMSMEEKSTSEESKEEAHIGAEDDWESTGKKLNNYDYEFAHVF